MYVRKGITVYYDGDDLWIHDSAGETIFSCVDPKDVTIAITKPIVDVQLHAHKDELRIVMK